MLYIAICIVQYFKVQSEVTNIFIKKTRSAKSTALRMSQTAFPAL